MKRIIIIVGMPGSGKTSAADTIKKKFSAKTLHTGDIIRQEIQRRGLRYSPTADMVIAHWFHTHGREKLLVERAWKRVKNSRKKLIVLEGLRSPEQLRYLEDLAKTKPIIISINAPFRTRAKREILRGRFGKDESISYLKQRENLEKIHGILKLIRKADYKIDNSKLSMKQFEKNIIKLIRKIKHKKI